MKAKTNHGETIEGRYVEGPGKRYFLAADGRVFDEAEVTPLDT